MTKEKLDAFQIRLQKRLVRQKAEIRKLKEDLFEARKELSSLRFQTLKMRLDQDVIAENPNSKASEKIIGIWKKRRNIRHEIDMALKN